MKQLILYFILIGIPGIAEAQQVLSGNELIRYALANFELFEKQRYELQASEFRQGEAWQLPPAEFNGQFGQLNSDTYDPLLEIRQSLGVPLEMIRRKQRLREETQLLSLEQELEKKEYVAGLKYLYAQWAYYFSLENLLRERETDLMDFERVAALRKEVGESGGSEILLAQSQRLQIQAELSKVTSRRNGLEALIYAKSGMSIEGFVPADQEEDLLNQISQLLGNTSIEHPALLLEKQKVNVWERKEREFRAAISPGIYAGYFRQRITDPTTVFNGLQGFQLGIQFPLVSGPYKASVKAASAMRKGAEIQVNLIDKQLEGQKQQLRKELDALQQALRSYQQDVLPKQKQLLGMAWKQFEQGAISYVDYSQIQTLRFEAEQSYRTMLLEAARNLSLYTMYLPANY